MGQNKSLEQFLVKKAYEICYALFRITARIKKESFAHRLEELGLDLLEFVSRSQQRESLVAIESLDRLVGFGADIGFIHQTNADTIRHELGNLNSAIAETVNSAKTEEVNLGGIFSSNLSPTESIPEESVAIQETDEFMNHTVPANNMELEGNGGNGNNGHGVVKTAIRQSAILDRIRQNGNCRLKELQEILPTVSERTIRYDLQRLLEQGAVERIGNGGPATHYRVKEQALEPI